jgi:hypothetical protein
MRRTACPLSARSAAEPKESVEIWIKIKETPWGRLQGRTRTGIAAVVSCTYKTRSVLRA